MPLGFKSSGADAPHCTAFVLGPRFVVLALASMMIGHFTLHDPNHVIRDVDYRLILDCRMEINFS